MLIGQLQPVPPYDFALSLRLARFLSVLDVARNGDYWRAVDLAGTLALIRVANSGTLDNPSLDVYRMASSGPVDDRALLTRAAHLLGVAADLRPFYDYSRQQPLLWAVVEPLVGLKHCCTDSLFEALMLTIIEQQIALNLAQRGERWLLAWADNTIMYEGETFYSFARPAQLARATINDLTPLKITRIRMGVMIDIARQQVAGQLDLEALQTTTPDQAQQQLIQLKGVGHWTAAWAVIRGLGYDQYIGENDVALQAAVNHYFYQQPGRAAKTVVSDTLRPHAPYAGALSFHLLMRWALMHYADTSASAVNRRRSVPPSP